MIKYVVLFTFILLTILFVILILRRYRYTHERFAFYSLGILFSYSATVVAPMLSGKSLLVQLAEASLGLIGQTTNHESDLYDKALSLLVLAFLGFVAIRIHAQWAGPNTERKTTSVRLGIQTGLLTDALAELEAKRVGQPLPLFDPDRKFQPVDELVIKDQSWKSRSARLILAYSDQYKIDLESDWMEEISAYLCTYGRSNVETLIICAETAPSGKDLDLVKKECSVQNFSPKKYVVLFKDKKTSKDTLRIQGFPDPITFTYAEILRRISDFSAYSDEIIRRFERVPVSNNNDLCLVDTYVGLSGETSSQSIDNLQQYIDRWVDEPGSKQIAILAEYGQGKSTLALKIAYDYFKHQIGNRIPVVIELRGRNPRNEQIDQILYPWCRRFGISVDSLIALMEAGQLLIILDGFDEMDFVGDAEVRFAHMRRLWEFATYNNNKVIFTGRPNFFFDTKELNWALLVRDELENRPFCEPLRIRQLTADAAKLAIKEFPESTRSGISAVLQDKSGATSLRELLLRPSTLVWAATVWDSLNEEISRAPILSAAVLRKFMAQADERQFSKGIDGVLMASERQYLTTAVAMRMFKKGQGSNQISASELQFTVKDALESVPDKLRDIRLPGEPLKIEISERFQDNQRLTESALTEVRASGILVEDLSRPNTFKFAHKSFFEYLVAEVFAGSRLQFFRDKILSGERIRVQDTSFFGVQIAAERLNPGNMNYAISTTRSQPEIEKFAGEILVNFLIECFRCVGRSEFDDRAIIEIDRLARDAWLGGQSRKVMCDIVFNSDLRRMLLENIRDGEAPPRMFSIENLRRLVFGIYGPLFFPMVFMIRCNYNAWQYGREGILLSWDRHST